MQKTDEQTAKHRPFHETIVSAIRHANRAELPVLARLITATKIPKGHDDIIAAWNQRRQETVLADDDLDDDLDVPADLLEQKQAAAEKSEGEKKGINLNELRHEVEMLLALLNDRHPGVVQGDEFIQERFQKLHKLISQALGE